MAGPCRETDPLESIVFVCGALRSGTTLLRLMIESHPAFSNPGEMDFMFEAPHRLDGTVDLDAYRRELARNRIFLATGAPLDPALGHDALVKSFARHRAAPGKLLTINIHRNFDAIPSIFPQARYVHILRDPRDVARSSISMGWAGNVYFGVDHWIDSERSFDRLRAVVPADRIHEIRNEDLIVQPRKALAGLCAFLGAPYDDAMLNYHLTSSYDPLDKRLVAQWRHKLSKRETALIEARVGPMLEKRGYPPSGYPAITPNAFDRFLMRQGNRIKRNMFEIRRFGVRAFLVKRLADVLPFEGFKRVASRRYNSVAETFLK